MTRNRPGIRKPPAATGGKNGSAGRRTGLVVRSRRLRNRKRSQERNSSFNTACACKTGVAMTGTISGTLLSAVTLTSSIFTVRCFKLRWRWRWRWRWQVELFFKMDQAAPADQVVLRNFGECREEPNLGGSVHLPARCHH